MPYALIGAIVGELIAANQGLGYLLAERRDSSTRRASLRRCSHRAAGLVLNFFVKILEKLVMPWHQDQELREFSI